MDNINQKILDLVESIKPFDILEQKHKKDACAWIQSAKQIFRIKKPDTPPKHLVSYFVVFDKVHRSLLLVDHKLAGLWLPPGGHVEMNENPYDTVIRECEEELGFKPRFTDESPQFITVTQTVGQNRHTDVSLWYLLEGRQEMELNWDNREFNAVKWWGLDDILDARSELFDPHMQRFVKKLNGLGL